MKKESATKVIICNGASIPIGISRNSVLVFDHNTESSDYNVRIKISEFVRYIDHLENKIKDLLEIAAYIYIADRKVSRGSKKSVEFHSWSRSFKFIIKVRDYEFWNRDDVKNKLNEVLTFTTGDDNFEFQFQRGRKSGRMGLFDTEGIMVLLVKTNSRLAFKCITFFNPHQLAILSL